MKIELEEPFKSKWKRAYLRVGNQGRQILDMVNTNQDRTTISYARYLMCVKIGYILSDEFEVDHIDNDKTNDDINNLQILTQLENIQKENNRYINEEQITNTYTCKQCGSLFTVTDRITKGVFNQRGTVPTFCSNSCNGKYPFENKTIGICITQDKIDKIKELSKSGFSNYKISKQLKVSAPTVAKYK